MPHPSIDQQVTFLYTRDLAQTSHFYETILEMPLVLDQGSCRIYQMGPDSFLGFCERAEAPVDPVGVIVTIVTAEVDAWHEFLVGKGVTIRKPPTLNPEYNIYHCFFEDPNGYLLEAQTFHDPAWPAAS